MKMMTQIIHCPWGIKQYTDDINSHITIVGFWGIIAICNVACTLTQMKMDGAGGKHANVIVYSQSADIFIHLLW